MEPLIGPTDEEAESRRFRRSLFVVEDVAAGETLTERNVRSIRPADGMHTREYEARPRPAGGSRAIPRAHRSARTCWRPTWLVEVSPAKCAAGQPGPTNHKGCHVLRSADIKRAVRALPRTTWRLGIVREAAGRSSPWSR